MTTLIRYPFESREIPGGGSAKAGTQTLPAYHMSNVLAKRIDRKMLAYAAACDHVPSLMDIHNIMRIEIERYFRECSITVEVADFWIHGFMEHPNE